MSVNETTMETEQLEALRRHGFGVAYRMLGSISEAYLPDPRAAAGWRL